MASNVGATGSCAHRLAPVPLAPAEASADLSHELGLKARALIETKPEQPDRGYVIYLARGAVIPTTMREVGRLREEAFRAVGEGTGQAMDLDAYDPHYLQLIAWSKRDRVITGAYRVGQADEILATLGPEGLYSYHLFDMAPRLLNRFRKNTLEMGRSFVSPEHQKGSTLTALWFGIARYLVENPSYRYLIGPVSISGSFHERSRDLMRLYLTRAHAHPDHPLLTPRHPPRPSATDAELDGELVGVHSLDDLQAVIRRIENDPTVKLPPLIEIYRKLDVRFYGFNWDEKFNCLDGFIGTNLTNLPASIHQKFMGPDHARTYRLANGLTVE